MKSLMPSLAESQARFIACLQKGPAYFPDDLFTEDADRALLGMKAHANTISHARLVALENAYPKLHEHMGHEAFHAVSRDYIDQPHIMAFDMNDIASDFAAFLNSRNHSATEIDLAKVEWAWIESYRSAEAEALKIADIASLDEASLLALPIAAHPAMRLVRLTGTLSPQLGELGNETPDALMIARPEEQILFHPMTGKEHTVASKISNISNMGNLLAASIELTGEGPDANGAMEPIIKLIQAGAIMKHHAKE